MSIYVDVDVCLTKGYMRALLLGVKSGKWYAYMIPVSSQIPRRCLQEFQEHMAKVTSYSNRFWLRRMWETISAEFYNVCMG